MERIFSTIEAIPLLENATPLPTFDEEAEIANFGESEAILRTSNDELPVWPWATPRQKKEKANETKSIERTKESVMRENVYVMARLRDMRQRMIDMDMNGTTPQEGDENHKQNQSRRDPTCLPLPALVMQSIDELLPLLLPSSKDLMPDQAYTIMKEASTIAILHAGFDGATAQVSKTLTDIGIQFMKQLATQIRVEYDRPMPQVPWRPGSSKSAVDINAKSSGPPKVVSPKSPKLSTSGDGSTATKTMKKTGCLKSIKSSISQANRSSGHKRINEKSVTLSREYLALHQALKRIGCDSRHLESHLMRTIRYGDHLRSQDRRLLKKSVKPKHSPTADASAGKPKAKKSKSTLSDFQLTAPMKEALSTLKLGESFMYNCFRHSALDLPIPPPSAYTFRPAKRKPRASAKLSSESKPRAAKKAKVTHPSPVAPESIGNALIDDELGLSNFEFGNFGDLDDNLPVKIEHLDMALNQHNTTTKSKQAPKADASIEFDASADLDVGLDLSNLDDLFDGDTMLGDDMLPTTF